MTDPLWVRKSRNLYIHEAAREKSPHMSVTDLLPCAGFGLLRCWIAHTHPPFRRCRAWADTGLLVTSNYTSVSVNCWVFMIQLVFRCSGCLGRTSTNEKYSALLSSSTPTGSPVEGSLFLKTTVNRVHIQFQAAQNSLVSLYHRLTKNDFPAVHVVYDNGSRPSKVARIFSCFASSDDSHKS